jgi:hypothetical protein
MSTKDSVKALYTSLSSYEGSIVASLEDAMVNPSMATDLLASLEVDEIETNILNRVSHNSSNVESSLQEAVDMRYAVSREVNIRAMKRSDYYIDAGEEHTDEKLRLEIRKVNTMQYLLGNTDIQRR